MSREVKNFSTYVIFNPESTHQQFASNQSGFLGLGPYTTDNDDDKKDSYIYNMH